MLLFHRGNLDTYWQGIIGVGKVTEFDKHHCSIELKVFLDVDNTLANSEPMVSFV